MVLGELDELKPGKSAGPDGLHPRVLIELKNEIKKPLALVFQKSLDEGRVPSSWKSAEVVPIYKKGPRQEPSNYRPVSLTSVCSKILERLIRVAMLRHMTENALFTNEQHGFRPRRSCVTQLLTVLETWTKSLDEGTAIDCIYLDYRKAFDSVPHERLLHKLNNLGIRDKLLLWIRSFLTGRRQRVRVEDALSDWCSVTSGIPQGSVLGPTLFLCFINDLPQQVTSELALFADDTKLFGPVRVEDEVQKLRDDLDCLHDWSDRWQLPFNKDKCKVVHYGRNNPVAQYAMDGTIMESLEAEKDLGVVFDAKLNFSEHIRAACRKANSRLGIVRRTFLELPPKPAVTLYKSLVRPIVEYAQTVAHPLYKREEDGLEKVQRRATKQMKGMKEKSYEERLKELKLPTLSYRRKRADMIQTYRILHQVDDMEQEKFFDRNQEGRTRGHGMKLKKSYVRTSARRKAFSQRVIEPWNALSDDAVTSKDVNSFKSQLEKCWKRDPTKYDDDTIISRPIHNQQDAQTLQEDLKKLEAWGRRWLMRFHPGKCQVLRVSRSRSKLQHPYSLLGTELEATDTINYLGITLSSDMRWSKHIDNVRAKASSKLGFLRRNVRIASPRLKSQLYTTVVRSSMEYASSVWSPHEAKATASLESVQRRAARWVLHRYQRTASVTQMLSELRWLTLAERRRISRLLMLFKISHSLVYVPHTFLSRTDSTQHTRLSNTHSFAPFQPRTNYYKYSFFPLAVSEWNSLPTSILDAPNVDVFKARLHQAAAGHFS